MRTDTDRWSYAFCVVTHFFFLPRVAIIFTILFWCFISNLVLTLFATADKLGPRRKWLILTNMQFIIVSVGFFLGCPSWRFKRVPVDYSKWLGPDWKPTYDGATMVISNHQGWFEIFATFIFVRPMPGFIAKGGVKTVPSIGTACQAVGSVFIDRRDRENRNQVFKVILERQEQAEQGLAPPMMVFPEGVTTNGN